MLKPKQKQTLSNENEPIYLFFCIRDVARLFSNFQPIQEIEKIHNVYSILICQGVISSTLTGTFRVCFPYTKSIEQETLLWNPNNPHKIYTAFIILGDFDRVETADEVPWLKILFSFLFYLHVSFPNSECLRICVK